MAERDVNTKLVDSWLDIVPAYISFVITFFKNPRSAFAAVAQPSRISGDLTSILLGGVGLAYVIGLALGGPLAEDPSRVLSVLRSIDVRYLPVVGVSLVVVLGLIAHGFAFLAGLWESDVELPGQVEDTVNATVGFASIFIPLTALALCAIPRLVGTVLPIVVAFVPGMFLIFAFPAALMAAHAGITYRHAFGTFVLAITVFVIAVSWFT
jgi:hypothetical protein